MPFLLSTHGAVFSTRPRGASLRSEAIASRDANEELRISFAGVQSISYSFADEFLGPLMSAPGTVVLEDVAAPLHRIILGALERRGIHTSEEELFRSSLPA
ncbi:MAG TPA: DUF4325 domain-containing protein [Solirubrobacterales bacterium]|jgi:hypothetical protein